MHLPRRLFAVLVLLLGAAVALAADVPIVGLKLIVIDKGGSGAAKTVFVAKDVAITKGTGTDPTQIEATFEIAYDSASGAYLMPQGGKWSGNKATAAKYGNKTAPTDGVVKVGLIKPGSLLKIVGRGLGDTPLDISTAPSGDVYVAATIVNGGEKTRLCTRFSGCTHKLIAGGTGYKLLCKGNSTGDPNCVGAMDPCATAPVAPVGGSYATCTTDIPSGETCPLTCANGYAHAGTDPTCLDGAFTGAATCTPATCAALETPLISSDCGTGATGDTCTVQCAAGAHRSDGGSGTSVSATCTGVAPGTSEWTYPTFTCTADPCPSAPPAPVGGSYPTCTTDIPSGQVCALSCANGYTHVGTDPTCQSGAFVGGSATCEPASCAPLTAPPSISSDCGTANTGGTCTVQCAAGMQRNDGGVETSVTATCTGTAPGAATWTYPTFTCAPPPCTTAPAAVTGGSYPGCPTTPIASGQTCTLACADGYTHSGTDPTCQSGSFTGVATCEPATCAPLAEPNVTSDCATAATGSSCTLHCAPGYHRSDGGVGTSVTGTCTGSAPGVSSWTHPTFTCEPDPCTAAPAAPVGGSYPSCTPPVPSGQQCPLACAAGYTNSGGTDASCFLGAYIAGTATCVPATCSPLAEQYVSSNCGTATTGGSCTLQCAANTHRTDGGMGSSVSGSCTGVGPGASVWAHPSFTCGPDPCPSAPVPPVGGSYPGCTAPPIASGTTCALACANGYSPTGTNPTCSFGQFDGNAPTCVAATCAPLNEAGIVSDCGTGATGGTCTARCQPGYHRTDGGTGTTVTTTCTGTGPGTSAWTHPTFTCEPFPCTGSPAPVPGGSYPTCTGTVPSGTTCPLSCANGYTKTGTDPSCYLGNYNGSTNECVPATCAAIPPLPFSTPPYTQTNCGAATTGATCTVSCQPGNIRNDGGGPPNSSVTATCTGTGPGASEWTYPTFTCIGQPCLVAPTVFGGHGSFPTCSTPPVPSKTDCPLVCDDGYMNAGSPNVTCYLGSYNGSASCVPIMGMADPPMASFCGEGGCKVMGPAGALALDGAAGLDGVAQLITALAAVQIIRRRRKR